MTSLCGGTIDEAIPDCSTCTRYDDEYPEDCDGEPREPQEFGCCLPPGECVMPGLHFPSECHTAADYERQHGHDWRPTTHLKG